MWFRPARTRTEVKTTPASTVSPSKQAPDVGVFVLGMHRSGTSAATRAVNLLGVPLGKAESLMGKGPANPTGYWEVASLTALNEQVLRALGGAGAAPPPLLPGWIDDERLRSLRVTASKTFFSAHSTRQWVWKDPRNSLLLPLWLDLLNVRPVIILAHRHPLEVASSLGARDGLSTGLSLALWERYVREALRSSLGLPLLIKRYDDLVLAPESWMASTRQFLLAHGVECAAKGDAITGWLDPGLRHACFGAEDVSCERGFSDAQRELFAAMERLVGHHVRLELDGLPDETPSTEAFFQERRELLRERQQANDHA
jgi:hypothetical protein